MLSTDQEYDFGKAIVSIDGNASVCHRIELITTMVAFHCHAGRGYSASIQATTGKTYVPPAEVEIYECSYYLLLLLVLEKGIVTTDEYIGMIQKTNILTHTYSDTYMFVCMYVYVCMYV